MQLLKAGEKVLRNKPIFLVLESGEDIGGEPYINVTKCVSMSEAKGVFIDNLKVFVCYNEDEDDGEFEPFEIEFGKEINAGKFIDYSARYFLKIEEV